ncbi:MAG: alpha/beta hydrolase [Planctomycetota bacterium]
MKKKVEFQNSNNPNITLAAYLFEPEPFDASQKYPAIVVTHPGGGVKEQTSGLYAEKLATLGFVTIAYDASHQGESTGEPRQLENPYIRTEDVSAVVDYLHTLPFVDPNRIGALGICAGGGYTIRAAISDRRIRAAATVSAVNIGAMVNRGWLGDQDIQNALGILEAGAQARTAEATGHGLVQMPMAPLKKEDTPYADLKEAWEYYHTPRASCPTAPGWGTARSLTQLATFDAFHFAENFLTQPLLVIAGSQAESKWMSDDLMHRAASKDKRLHIIDGANHMMLYDIPQYVDQATEQLGPFFRAKL